MRLRHFSAKYACAVFLLCIATAIAAHAQTFTNLVDFNGEDGANPFQVTLVQGVDGNLYGTTAYGGAHGQGVVFRMSTSGALSDLYDFDITNGAVPFSGLTLLGDGSLYGTTSSGGINGEG